ncbi:alpha/beta hydrolase [Nonomuraea sp. NPDC004580]|uniref:alpha/beta hydrolase n=1 Tax=Nonomuraea sp. NPDC004580 TaxID=3154552 RepID=UPI0033BABF71
MALALGHLGPPAVRLVAWRIRDRGALGGSLLTVEGEQHGAILTTNACVGRAVAGYLIDLRAPAEGARCTL